MEENKTTKTTQHEHHYYYGCFPGKSWIAFCGVTLVIIGSFWLLEGIGNNLPVLVGPGYPHYINRLGFILYILPFQA